MAQVSHFTRLTRWLNITHLSQFSQLFRTQWREHPAVAIASLIIHAYKRRSVLTAQNSDVAPTIVGVTYLRSMKNVDTDTCTLYAHHKQICTWQQHLIIHKPLFCQSQTLNFGGVRSWPSQNIEVQNLSFYWCAQMWFWWWYTRRFCFSLKTSLSHIAL